MLQRTQLEFCEGNSETPSEAKYPRRRKNIRAPPEARKDNSKANPKAEQRDPAHGFRLLGSSDCSIVTKRHTPPRTSENLMIEQWSNITKNNKDDCARWESLHRLRRAHPAHSDLTLREGMLLDPLPWLHPTRSHCVSTSGQTSLTAQSSRSGRNVLAAQRGAGQPPREGR